MTNGDIYDLMKAHEAFVEDMQEEFPSEAEVLNEHEQVIELCEKELQERGL